MLPTLSCFWPLPMWSNWAECTTGKFLYESSHFPGVSVSMLGACSSKRIPSCSIIIVQHMLPGWLLIKIIPLRSRGQGPLLGVQGAGCSLWLKTQMKIPDTHHLRTIKCWWRTFSSSSCWIHLAKNLHAPCENIYSGSSGRYLACYCWFYRQ